MSFDSYLPDEETSKQLKKTYKSILSKQNSAKLIGKSFMFKISEEMSNFYIVKAVKNEENSKKIVAIVPKCLASTLGIQIPLTRPDVQAQGFVLEEHASSGLMIVSFKPEFGMLKD
jgi:hypothetical protein